MSKPKILQDIDNINLELDNHTSQLADNVQQINGLALSKKPAFLEQFITGFYGRGQLASEKATENVATETNITVARAAGYGGLDVADTSKFKEGSVIVIKYDDGTYATHFVTQVSSGTILNIKPPLTKATTTATKVERCWFNSAHAGKFYMRYLAQRLV
ncbi:MAG TPA: hypothetical protein VFF14_11710, partial [Candidatus Deferrimicrobium sp.]|nr:hypothetical protein [Candidatus Deferrimicrobium sp.]